ncbi:glycoside hydrolase family 113 [Hymenobacter perfusus]|uniref:GTA TIM-barrel-like domain-containing protein n=1 Tax=Hymenobacter perfusus TaxID=1236770 RepID=A0A428K7B8_9BACT|nr:hypothetical protein [Hymenobacter perfusus]RSK42160.1 hypothetical protein EI293_14615 [Hymenobacter perfusus]
MPAFRSRFLVWGLLPMALILAGMLWMLRPRPVASQLPPLPPATPALPTDDRLRGVSWVAGDSVSSLDLEPLRRAHVTWIAQTPFGWQPGAAVPEVRLNTGSNRHYWGEGDRGVLLTAQRARQQGIRTLLKPHLWLRNGGTWPGDINMTSAADWDAWFASYSVFILHYAHLAETGHLEGLCIGTELEHASGPAHEQQWRQLIRRIRAVYHGPLTYAANWSGEFEQVRFWDALDFIGVQAYFPLSTTNSPSKDNLLQAWQAPLRRLEAVQKRYRKPVVFTEIGYKTTPDAAIEPWAWPDRMAVLTTPDEATQAACYAAMFETFWGRKWFKGLFVWKWYPGLQPDGSARRHLDFTPQHKPAERVMAEWYGK